MNVDTDTQWAYWEGIRDFYQVKIYSGDWCACVAAGGIVEVTKVPRGRVFVGWRFDTEVWSTLVTVVPGWTGEGGLPARTDR